MNQLTMGFHPFLKDKSQRFVQIQRSSRLDFSKWLVHATYQWNMPRVGALIHRGYEALKGHDPPSSYIIGPFQKLLDQVSWYLRRSHDYLWLGLTGAEVEFESCYNGVSAEDMNIIRNSNWKRTVSNSLVVDFSASVGWSPFSFSICLLARKGPNNLE